MTIKILELTPGCMPEVYKVGDWIDLFTAEDITLKAPYAHKLHKRKDKPNSSENIRDVDFFSTLIPLGVRIKMPKGYEGILVPRSSAFLKHGLLQTNSIGIIDNLYYGEDDEWKLPVVATQEVTIPKGTRLCQFRIQLSQKATFLQKLQWLFSSKVTLKQVDSLDGKSRGGFGSTDTPQQ